MLNIENILQNKEAGTDCTEQQSAHIKSIVKDIINRFPMEYSEALQELERAPDLTLIEYSLNVHGFGTREVLSKSLYMLAAALDLNSGETQTRENIDNASWSSGVISYFSESQK